MVQMAVSPLPQWFEGSEYTHKVAVCVMKYGPYYFGTDFRTFARRGFPYYQRSDLCWRDRGDADAVRQGR